MNLSLTSYRYIISHRPVDEVVGLAPRVLALGVLYALPLHAVLWRDLSEIGLDDGRVLPGRETALVGAGAEVDLAFSLHQGINGD